MRYRGFFFISPRKTDYIKLPNEVLILRSEKYFINHGCSLLV